jgi:putative Mg2+ transporter-C (MgtC) family protein
MSEITYFEELVQLLIAAAFGGVIGVERQIQGQNAGFRTQLLVCLGSCLFTILSVHFYEIYGKVADPARISAQIVVGIGFLGAGAILRHGEYIRGLTTAATLWAVSAIGIAVGLGEYSLATFATFLALGNLIILKQIEHILPQHKYCTVTVKLKGTEELNINELVAGYDIKVISSKFDLFKERNTIEQKIALRYKKSSRFAEFIAVLKANPDLIELSVS